MASRIVTLLVNGTPQEVIVRPGTTLVSVLRDQLELTGTKRGCADGSCGACSVVVDGKAVRSCLIPAETVDEAEVTTVEGITPVGGLGPLQEALVEGFATQCGFCNSGMLMVATALIAENPDPSDADIMRAISGNVCRCTGYHPIIRAIRDAAAKMRGAQQIAAE
ncbi:(2Fe-2S)-binding protein [Jiella avicenniae]|uniref:(2Fe-2S)-binding protein n=1 Tax=Jiella avicenniae TaxID=2907202 RepID=A0A9X1P1H9_9HYPH|nr:(2Fe-2S)-binding protein [Jiella avicenniae]MCE7029670.1 (2Fe-2S)-binding protein [Jiella avicenniae]